MNDSTFWAYILLLFTLNNFNQVVNFNYMIYYNLYN